MVSVPVPKEDLLTIVDAHLVGDGEMTINGIKLQIPPDAISVVEANKNAAVQTLRTQESTKVRSGHGGINITITAYFEGRTAARPDEKPLDGVNASLMPILYSLKRLPLCFVENELLRSKLPVKTGALIPLFSKGVEVSTVPGHPYLLMAVFQFVWFNHRPYAPDIEFRYQWLDSGRRVEALRGLYLGSTGASPSGFEEAGKRYTDHVNRYDFIETYGHPSTAFNATAEFDHGVRISRARPFLEHLWPYAMRSTNPAVGTEVGLNVNPYRLESFDESFRLGFTVMQSPSVVKLRGLELSTYDAAMLIANGDVEKVFDTTVDPAEVQAAARRLKGSKYPAPTKWSKEIRAASQATGLEEAMIMAFMYIETGAWGWRNPKVAGPVNKALRSVLISGVPNKYYSAEAIKRHKDNMAKTGDTVDQYCRAVGFMQVIGSARAQYGYSYSDAEDPAINILIGARVAKSNLARYGSLSEVAWAYNAGPGGRRKDKDELKDVGLPTDIPAPHPKFTPGRNRIMKRRAHYIQTAISAYQQYGGRGLGFAQSASQIRGNATKAQPTVKPFHALDQVAQYVGIQTDALSRDEVVSKLEGRVNKSADMPPDERAIIQELLRVYREGWTFYRSGITGKVAMAREEVLVISGDNGSIIPLNVSVGFANNLVQIPMRGHRFPTLQYMGGQHSGITVTFRAEGETGRLFVEDLKALVHSTELSAIHFREFSRQRGVRVVNPLVNSVNIERCMIDDIAVETVRGAPNGLNVSIRFIDATIRESQQNFASGRSGGTKTDAYLQFLAYAFDKGWLNQTFQMYYNYTSGRSRGRDPIYPEQLQQTRGESEKYSGRYYSVDVDISSTTRVPGDLLRTVTEIAGILNDGPIYKIPVKFGLVDLEEIPGAEYQTEDGVFPVDGQLGAVILPRIVWAQLYHSSDSPMRSPALRSVLFRKAQRGLALATKLQGSIVKADLGKMSQQTGAGLDFYPGLDCYPDLNLPPNPITGLSIDTNPDFCFYNMSDARFCNSNLGKIVNGLSSGRTKDTGLRRALAAIDCTVSNISDIYEGNDTGTGLNRIDIGRIDPETGIAAYSGLDFVTGGKTLAKNDQLGVRGAPDLDLGTIIQRTDGLELSVGSDIARRGRGKKKYDRDKALSYHLGNSPQKSVIEKNPSFNQNRVAQQFNSAEYKRVMADFATKYSGTHYTLRRAFPTFKVLFVEENKVDGENTGSGVISRLTEEFQLEDFYGINAIEEIRVVKNKDMASDVCVIRVMDIDGILYNRSYLDDGSSLGLRKSKAAYLKSPFSDTVIKEGMKVVVSMGYDNDPEQLETVFVGQVASFSGDSVVEILCQSYGSELVQQRFGTDYSENASFWNAGTQTILHDCMDREEVRHFGRWELKDASPLGIVFGHEKLRPDGQVKKVWTWKPSVVDDNIFVPKMEDYVSTWNRIWGDVEYVYWDTTIWDVFKEMELRHPGYVASAVPYGSGPSARMTMFFGNPGMEYLSRPAKTGSEIEQEIVGNNLNNADFHTWITNIGESTIGGTIFTKHNEQHAYAVGLREVTNTGGNKAKLEALRGRAANLRSIDIDALALATDEAIRQLNEINKLTGGRFDYKRVSSVNPAEFWRATAASQGNRLRIFRNYEMITDMHDIIENRIRADHRDTYNSIELVWASGNDANIRAFYDYDGVDVMTVNADDNIKPHHIRRAQMGYPNCTTEDLARRYASQLVANSLKETYKGHVMSMGRPKLKPYDMLWLYDAYTDMAGPVEINEVVHTISAETGMVSEILPHMVVAVKEEVTTLGVDALGAFFTEQMKEYTVGAALGIGTALTAGLGGVALATGTTTAKGVGVAGISGSMAANAIATGGENPTREHLIGFGGGLALGAGLLAHPIIVPVAGILAGNLAYKFLKYNLTREPIIVTPLIKAGKPFVTGIEGMESDGLVVSDIFTDEKGEAAFRAIIGRKWKYFIDGFGEAAKIAQFGWANWIHGA